MDELRAARKVLEKQGIEIEQQAALLALERQISVALKDLRTLDASEKQHLRAALDAKDRQIASAEAAIAVLKKNQWTVWRATKAALLGGAAGIVIGAIFINK